MAATGRVCQQTSAEAVVVQYPSDVGLADAYARATTALTGAGWQVVTPPGASTTLMMGVLERQGDHLTVRARGDDEQISGSVVFLSAR